MSRDFPTKAEQALEKLAQQITRQWSGPDHCNNTYILAGPCNLPVKLRNGSYQTKGFIGGEQFLPRSAYVGKKGHLVLVFSPVPANTYAYMELPAKDAEKIEGFAVAMLQLITSLQSGVPIPFVTPEERAAQRQADEQELLDNPVYASW